MAGHGAAAAVAGSANNPFGDPFQTGPDHQPSPSRDDDDPFFGAKAFENSFEPPPAGPAFHHRAGSADSLSGNVGTNNPFETDGGDVTHSTNPFGTR